MKLNEIINQPIQIESKDKNRFKAKFIEADTATKNGRVYPLSVLQKAVRDFSERLAVSNASFKSHSSSEIKDVSHLIEKIWMDGKTGYIEGRIVPTQVGRDTLAILSAGGRIGVSMRGTGTISKRDDKEIVNDDYQLQGIDLALNPAYEGARIRPLGESWDGKQQKQLSKKKLLRRYEYAKKTGFKGNFEKYQEILKKKNG